MGIDRGLAGGRNNRNYKQDPDVPETKGKHITFLRRLDISYILKVISRKSIYVKKTVISELKNAQNGNKNRVPIEKKLEKKFSELENNSRKDFY